MEKHFYNLQKWARQHIPNDIHFFGPAGVGKTTFIEQLKNRQSEAHVTLHTKLNQYHFKDDLSKIELVVFDTGGDKKFRSNWFNILHRKPPLGFVFVTDHKSLTKSLGDLDEIWGTLSEIKYNNSSKFITRAMLLFINKFDIWKDKCDAYELAQKYQDKVLMFKELEIFPIIRWGCAKYYFDFNEFFDTIVLDFYKILLDPHPNLSLYPLEDTIFYD